MLKKETKDALSKLGFDVSKLEEAVKSELEQSLEVPKLFTESETQGLLNEDDKKTFGNNRFNEGKDAMSEIMAKQFKETYSLDIEGKDLTKVVQAIHDKGLDSGNDKELSGRFKNLQEKYTALYNNYEASKVDHAKSLMQQNQKFNLITAIAPKQKTKIAVPDLVDLYMLRHKIDSENGSPVIIVDGKVVKNNLESPVEPKTHFLTWLDKNEHFVKDGMGQGDQRGSGDVPDKFLSESEAYQYMKENDIEPMSSKGLEIISKLEN